LQNIYIPRLIYYDYVKLTKGVPVMATMKDIARLAGVSHGTVSNVINHRGNVSSKKIRLVEEAIQKAGYKANSQAQKLRKEKICYLAFILPNLEERIYRVFYTTLKTMVEAVEYETSLYLTNSSPEAEKSCVQQALSGRPEYLVVFSCTESSDDYADLQSKIIFINHPFMPVRKNQTSLYFDFDAMTEDFVKKIKEKESRRVAFFFDSLGIPMYRCFYEALGKRLRENRVELTPFFYDSRQTYQGAIAVLDHSPSFDLVITNNPLYIEKLTEIQEVLNVKIPDCISFDMSESISFAAKNRYEFDYREMACLAFKVITEGDIWSGESQAVRPKGFRRMYREVFGFPRQENREINLLIVTSPTAEILSSISPYFKRCTGIGLKVVSLPYEELFQVLSAGRISNPDLIRIDMAWASRFEKELYTPLSQKSISLADSFLPSIQNVYIPNIQDCYCLPLDPSIQMLFYRRDIFENPTIRRLYYEERREQLEIPRTFDAYDQIASFFTASLNPASPVTDGSSMVYGSATVAACDVLPRVKSVGGELFDKSGKIRIDTAVFRKALNDYLALKKYSSPDVNYWWGDALNSFSGGFSAMTIVFINHVSRIIRANDRGLSVKVGSAPVPGNFPLLGGGAIGISRQSKNKDRCSEFFNWVYSEEIANMITLLGGLSPCKSVFENEEILEIYPWLKNIDVHFKQGWRKVQSGRYPHFDNHHFERIFGSAVRNAALGLISVDEALKSAQAQCEKEF
jgi:multiple sugar transport system substrate-binding protein